MSQKAIRRKDLEAQGWRYIDAICNDRILIFGKGCKRIAWNTKTQTVELKYKLISSKIIGQF